MTHCNTHGKKSNQLPDVFAMASTIAKWCAAEELCNIISRWEHTFRGTALCTQGTQRHANPSSPSVALLIRTSGHRQVQYGASIRPLASLRLTLPAAVLSLYISILRSPALSNCVHVGRATAPPPLPNNKLQSLLSLTLHRRYKAMKALQPQQPWPDLSGPPCVSL